MKDMKEDLKWWNKLCTKQPETADANPEIKNIPMYFKEHVHSRGWWKIFVMMKETKEGIQEPI
jgi:hypothetical protein